MADIVTSTDQALEDARKAREKEWGTYVAKEPISLNGVPAFNVGDPVPVSHVERIPALKDAVAKVGTKAAAAVTETAPA